jgi:hypothetical protein
MSNDSDDLRREATRINMETDMVNHSTGTSITAPSNMDTYLSRTELVNTTSEMLDRQETLAQLVIAKQAFFLEEGPTLLRSYWEQEVLKLEKKLYGNKSSDKKS